MRLSKYFLTTAIPYPSGEPHVGHAFEMIGADAFARFKRRQGVDTFLLGGLDENSQRVSRQAEAEGLDTRVFVEQIAPAYTTAWDSVDVVFDDFVRTTEPRHHAAVGEFYRRVFDNGDIYKGTYDGWYCVSCEAFYTEEELVGDLCPIHRTKPEWVSENNYFFALSKYEEPLRRLYAERPDFVIPETRRNEVMGFINQGLKDFSISRESVKWGIPLPNDPEQVIYVWFDALINYITGVGFGQNGSAARFEKWWPADAHVIGKDIVRFHAVYWPAMLMAAGIELPRQIVVHGWVGFGGAELSQSRGNTVRPAEVIERYGSDALRYFLLREVPFDRDGDFTWENLARRYEADLGNDLGNLVMRTTSMLTRYFDGRVPGRGGLSELETGLQAASEVAWARADQHLEGWRFHQALIAIWEFVTSVNQYIDRTGPWRLAKDDASRERLGTVLTTALDAIRQIALMIGPFMPRSSDAIHAQLGLAAPAAGDTQARDWTSLPAGHEVPGGPALFPRVEDA